MFRNRGDGGFEEIGPKLGEAFAVENVVRGASAADYDQDGDEDILVNVSGDAPQLLRNDGGNRNGWLALQLVGRESNRSAVGARVTVRVGERTLIKEVKAGFSFLSQGGLELIFGLGDAATVENVQIRWPSGEVQDLGSVTSGTRLTVLEGVGPL